MSNSSLRSANGSEAEDSNVLKSRRRSPRTMKGNSGIPVLCAAYLDRHSSKNDLVRRLRIVVDALADEDVEANSVDYPGLAGLASVLVEDQYLSHRDKEVRLHTVLACMEIFYLYAPDPPWDEGEIIRIFVQTIRQLANLAVCTSPSQPNFAHYFKLLEQLAAVKIGVVLVELTRRLESDSSPVGIEKDNETDGIPSSDEALEVLSELIRTILQSVNIDHPSDVTSYATAAISACVEEFDGTVPIPVLDEILICVSAGPVVYVTNPAYVEATAEVAAAKKKGRKVEKKKMPQMQIQQTNQSYMIAASIIRRTEDRISTPIASLLNGLLNGESNIIEQTNISSSDVATITSSTGTVPGAIPQPSSPSADVWTIVYELHRISPQILTTVIGTVANSLQSPNVQKRMRVTKLLGRLFYSTSSNIGVRFHPCYREWIRRSTDIDPKIRLMMVKCLIAVLSNKSNERDLCMEAADSLVQMVRQDPSLDVRLLGVHEICDLAHNQKGSDAQELESVGRDSKAVRGKSSNSSDDRAALIPARLLKAVGNRVSSKHKTERRDAVTGLAQIYYRHYILEKLKVIQNAGDDCAIDLIIDTLRENCLSGKEDDDHTSKQRNRSSLKSKSGSAGDDTDDLELFDIDQKYKFIPRLVFESAYFTDATDPEMRNRVIQIVDDVLLGSGTAGLKDSSAGNKKQPLTPTSRAVGLAIIIHSLDDKDMNNGSSEGSSNAFKWMCSLLLQRAKLQHAVSAYIDTRSKIKDSTQDESLAAEADAIEKLENVAALSTPLLPNPSPTKDLSSILKSIHQARDKHIFRLLATISSASHSPLARSRAFDELPKRAKSLGPSAATWIKCLARRCAMGHFINVEIITHCILLAQEAFHEDEFDVAMILLKCVKTAVNVFPTLGGTQEGFSTLVELFGECRGSHAPDVKKSIDESGIVTMLSGILAITAPAYDGKETFMSNSTCITNAKISPNIDTGLQNHLLQLCTRDGTPEQAKNAVYTMASLVNDRTVMSRQRSFRDISEKETKAFDPLLKSLTSPSRMTLTSNGKINYKIVSILTALTALVECSPTTFSGSDGTNERGAKAIKFALETVLLGRGNFTEEDYSDVQDEDKSVEEDDSSTVETTKRRSSKGNRKPNSRINCKGGRFDSEKNLVCQRICAAIELLVAHIRSTILFMKSSKVSKSEKTERKKSEDDSKDKFAIKIPTSDHLSAVFNLLINLLQESGLPPSSRDRQYVKGSSERATLRQCASVNLLRLCDSSLNIENTYLTPRMWHIFSSVFLDEESAVRENIMEELSMMFTGAGKYRQGRTGYAPSLRFLALVVLCPDSDYNHGNISANGNAANVGRRSITTKSAALQCISSLRRTCEATSLQCRAISRIAEKNFDNNLKMMLMPEFAVPYALHLLAFRRETPCAGGTEAGVNAVDPKQSNEDIDLDEEFIAADEESRQKILRKRLRWLFEPLVQSLGESADNISFLLRQTELLGNKYKPLDVSRTSTSPKSVMDSSVAGSKSFSLDTSIDNSFVSTDDLKRDKKAHAKLKVICTSAREVLLNFVKKDVNLTPYPGAIQIPGALYSRADSAVAGGIAKSKSSLSLPQKLPKTKVSPKQSKLSPSFKTSNTSSSSKQEERENQDGDGAGDSFVDWNDGGDVILNQDSFSFDNSMDKIDAQGQLKGFSLLLSPIPQSRSPQSTPTVPLQENRRHTRSKSKSNGVSLSTDMETPSLEKDTSNTKSASSGKKRSFVNEERVETKKTKKKLYKPKSSSFADITSASPDDNKVKTAGSSSHKKQSTDGTLSISTEKYRVASESPYLEVSQSQKKNTPRTSEPIIRSNTAHNKREAESEERKTNKKSRKKKSSIKPIHIMVGRPSVSSSTDSVKKSSSKANRNGGRKVNASSKKEAMINDDELDFIEDDNIDLIIKQNKGQKSSKKKTKKILSIKAKSPRKATINSKHKLQNVPVSKRKSRSSLSSESSATKSVSISQRKSQFSMSSLDSDNQSRGSKGNGSKLKKQNTPKSRGKQKARSKEMSNPSSKENTSANADSRSKKPYASTRPSRTSLSSVESESTVSLNTRSSKSTMRRSTRSSRRT